MDTKFDEATQAEKVKRKVAGTKAGSWMKILDERTRLLMARQTQADKELDKRFNGL